MSRTTAVFVAATAATLTACSSSSDDTPETISALTAPTGVSVVEADDSGDLWVLTVDADGNIERGDVFALAGPPLALAALARE